MKKYLLGIAAIALAIGFSAFKEPKKAPEQKKFVDHYFFEVTIDMTSGLVSESNTSFLQRNTSGSVPDLGCNANTNICVIEITDPQLVEPDGTGYKIKNPTGEYAVKSRRD